MEEQKGLALTLSSNFNQQLEGIYTIGQHGIIGIPRRACEDPEFVQALEKILHHYTIGTLILYSSFSGNENLEISSFKRLEKPLLKMPRLSIMTKNFHVTEKDAEVIAQLIRSKRNFTFLNLVDEATLTNTCLEIISDALKQRPFKFIFRITGYTETLAKGIEALQLAKVVNPLIQLGMEEKFVVDPILKNSWKITDLQEITSIQI